jgi:hypothetical protein
VPKDAPSADFSNAGQRMPQSRGVNRVDQVYQSNFNGAEKAKRAKNVEETVASNQSVVEFPQRDAIANATGEPRIIESGSAGNCSCSGSFPQPSPARWKKGCKACGWIMRSLGNGCSPK